jgi:hypothetical protein
VKVTSGEVAPKGPSSLGGDDLFEDLVNSECVSTAAHKQLEKETEAARKAARKPLV